MPEPLSPDQIESALSDLPGWNHAQGKLQKSFKFKTFKEAMGFIVRIAFEAEGMDHHPELRNVYNQVEIALSTHDADGKVTLKDVDLANAIEAVNWR